MTKKQVKAARAKDSNLHRWTPSVILSYLRAYGRVNWILLPDLVPGNRPRIQFEKYYGFRAAVEVIPELEHVFNCTAKDVPGFWTHT